MDPPCAPRLLPKGVRQACNWTLPLYVLTFWLSCDSNLPSQLPDPATSQSPLCERFLFYSVFVPCLVPPPHKNPVLSWPSQIETNSVGLPGQHHKQCLVAGPQGQLPSRFGGLDSQEVPGPWALLGSGGWLTVTVLAGPELVLLGTPGTSQRHR